MHFTTRLVVSAPLSPPQGLEKILQFWCCLGAGSAYGNGYRQGCQNRASQKKIGIWDTFFKWGAPSDLGDRCLTESAVMVSTSRAFQNTTTFDLRLISHRVTVARSWPIEKWSARAAHTWSPVNSTQGIRIWYPIQNGDLNLLVTQIEGVSEGVCSNFKVVT